MASPTKGNTIQYAIGSFSDEDTTQAYKHIRVNEEPEFPTDIKLIEEQPHIGKAHFADRSDSPLTYEGIREDALKVQYTFRSNRVASEIDFVRAAFESAGCNIDTVDSSEALDSALSEGSFDTTSDLISAGEGAVIGKDDTLYYPTLVHDVSGTGPYDCDTAFDPNITADTIYKSVTITPRVTEVSSSRYLSFKKGTRISATSDEEHFLAKHCALSSIGDITIEPQSAVSFDFGFHVTDVDDLDAAFSSETFVDSEKYPIFSGIETAFCVSGTAGSWSTLTNNSTNKINTISATINLGLSTVHIPGSGNDDVNNVQGFMSKFEDCTITLKALFDKDYWDDLEDGTFQNYYLHFVKPSTSASVPCLGFFFPRVYQFEAPNLINESDNYYAMELKLKATGAELDSSTGNDSATNSPWYIVYNLLA